MATNSRKVMTFADYLVIAVSPALIMTLVGSLSFFLLELSYTGNYRERLLWVLGWFVFGAVLVARIAMQEGRQHAALYGFGLAGATGLFAIQYVDQAYVAIVLLAVIWWCTGKLTWDCTLIDDRQDASGSGLLQQGEEAVDLAGQGEAKADDSLDAATSRPHAPGLWVMYFSLAALPLFGIGQLFIPKQDIPRRTYCFQLLLVYVASGLGLLLATSFLGLRRYLRQRNLQMPATMAASWLFFGSLLSISLMLLAVLIPRPQGEYTITALIDRADQSIQRASRFAQLKNGKGSGEGRRIGDVDPKGEGSKVEPHSSPTPDSNGRQDINAESGEPASHGKSSTKSRHRGSKPSDESGGQGNDSTGSSDSNPTESKENRNGRVQASNKNNSPQSPSRSAQSPQGDQPARSTETRQLDASRPTSKTSPPLSGWTNFLAMIAPFFKWLIYGALLVAALFLMALYREKIFRLLIQFWEGLLGLFFRSGRDSTTDSNSKPPPAPPRPYSSFTNPFASGASSRMSVPAIVVYVFEALEAWGREQGLERSEEQTPLEFAETLAQHFPPLAERIHHAARLYSAVAYSRQRPSREAVAVLEQLWKGMDRISQRAAESCQPANHRS